MKRLLQSLFIVLLLSIGSISCTEDIDFTQFDDLEATPIYEAGILYLESSEDLINLISGADLFSQNFSFDAFSSKIFADRVIDGTITFVVENTTSKELDITVELLDADENITDTEVFSILPGPTAIIQREIAYGVSGRSIDIIKTLTAIKITARNLGDNSSVSDLPDPLITLKSSGKFRLRLK